MTSFRYPISSLRGDYLRGSIGVFVTLGLLIAATKITIFQYLFAGAAILFLGFFLRTVQRHLTVFHLSDEFFSAKGPFGKTIHLPDLKDIRLRYFSTTRDRKGDSGWFELTLKDSRSAISIDSSISNFDKIMLTCIKIIKEREILVSETTTENFSSAGFALENPTLSNNDPTKNQSTA